MAKIKLFAVEIEYTVREVVHVAARRPNGAVEQALTDEVYNQAHAYDCDEVTPCYGPRGLPKDAHVVGVRVAG